MLKWLSYATLHPISKETASGARKVIVNQEKHVSKKLQHMPKIIAAIPCLNEERYIGSVVLRTKRFVSSVVVVRIIS